MCSGAKSAAATTASTKGACSGHEMTSSSHKTAKVTRTASAKGKRSLKPKTAAKPANGSTAVNVTQGTAGLQAIIDPQTGLVVQATAEQLAQLAAASKAQAGATIESQPRDPEIIALPGGGEMMRVPDRLMMHAIAHRDANGKITLGCQQGNGPIAPLPAKSTVPVEQSTWEVK